MKNGKRKQINTRFDVNLICERVFSAIPAIYCGVKANYTINMFHTNEESTARG